MTLPSDISDGLDPRGTRRRIIATAAALLAITLVGLWAVVLFVRSERAEALHEWQVRLSLAGAARADAVDAWLADRQADVGAVATNTSVTLYMSQLAHAGGNRSAVPEEAAQAAYIRNYLTVVAERSQFQAGTGAPAVGANLSNAAAAGLAIVDGDANVLVQTAGMPALDRTVRSFVLAAAPGEAAFLDVHLNAHGKPMIGFLAPIYEIQTAGGAARQIGAVLGLRPFDESILDLTRQPEWTGGGIRHLLVRRDGDVVRYLSPPTAGAAPLALQFPAGSPEDAAAFAVADPGRFAAKRDPGGDLVLATGRPLANAPWTLLSQVDEGEALADSNARLGRLTAFLVVAVLGVAFLIVAIWRHGASRRAAGAMARFKALATRFEKQGRFLRLVTDSQPSAIFICGPDGRLRFANRTFAEQAGVSADDLAGKPLASTIGPREADRIEQANRDARDGGTTVARLRRVERADGATAVLQSQHIPLAADAIVDPGEVLVVEEDVTPVVQERERNERILKQIVDALVTVIDKRDPYAAHHSIRVGTLARAVAEEMALDPVLVETARIAGSLMNLGKIAVPVQLLTKSEGLSEHEFGMIRASITQSAELLRGIEFPGPVVETLGQVQERWDGTGAPAGLKGKEILATARIVAVANAFVAMTSPRAHRDSLDVDVALDALFGLAGSAYDRSVVSALTNYLENKGGRHRLAAAGGTDADA